MACASTPRGSESTAPPSCGTRRRARLAPNLPRSLPQPAAPRLPDRHSGSETAYSPFLRPCEEATPALVSRQPRPVAESGSPSPPTTCLALPHAFVQFRAWSLTLPARILRRNAPSRRYPVKEAAPAACPTSISRGLRTPASPAARVPQVWPIVPKSEPKPGRKGLRFRC